MRSHRSDSPQDVRQPRVRDRFGLFALVIYSGLSLAFLGRAVVSAPAATYIARSNDPSVYIWCLCWWPYALAHRLNPMITHVVWAPSGFNLAWTTAMPLPALLAAPLTHTFGPVVVYNALCVLAPAAAAWSGFLLCRRITAHYIAAAVGGYVFGFSAYVLAETRGHLPLVLIFPVPLALLLVLKRLEGDLTRSWFSVLLGAVLVTALLCWAELYATMTLFGAIAVALAMFLGGDTGRQRVRSLVLPTVAAYALSLIAALPYLYYFFQPGYPRSPINSPRLYSADLLNLLVPTPVNALGGVGPVERMAQSFSHNLLETGAYFGLPLVAITWWFARERWHQSASRILVTFLIVVCVLMCGPRLHVAGAELFGMPWKLAQHVPLLRNALPVRFSLYAFLALAMIVSVWLSAPRPRGLKLAAIILLAVFLTPNLHSRFWSADNDTPEFFTQGLYRRYLKPGENVILLPYGINGSSMLWQAAAGFYFRMAGGWTSLTPQEFLAWPIVSAMLTQTYLPDIGSQLRAFMAAHEVQAIIVNDAQDEFWRPMLAPLDGSPIRSGGVVLYSASPAELAAFRTVTALQMERRSNLARFTALLLAAHDYLLNNGDVAQLTPMRAQQKGLLPPRWVNDPDVRTNQLYLGPWDRDQIAVGVVGSYWGLQPVISKYRAAAAQIFLPFPRKLTESRRGDHFMLLVMVFERQGLARALRAGPAQ